MDKQFRFVVDANILFSAILKKEWKTNSILFSPIVDFFVPDFLFTELQKYEQLFAKKLFLYREYVMNFLARGITVYPTQFMENDIFAVQDIVNVVDPKDTIYVALAYKLQIPLQTNDKKLKDNLDIVKIVNTEEIVSILGMI